MQKNQNISKLKGLRSLDKNLHYDNFVHMLLGFCFVVNAYYVNLEYFERATHIEVQIETNETIVFPPIQICLPYNMSDYRTLHNYRPEKYPINRSENFSEDKIKDAIRKMPISKLNSFGTIHYDISIECSVYYTGNKKISDISTRFDKSIASEVACDRFFPVRRTIMYYHTLDLFQCNIYMATDSNETDAFYIENELPTENLYRFKLKYKLNHNIHDVFPGIQLTFLAEKMFPIGLYFQLYTLPLIDVQKIDLSFDIVTEKLLKPPYNTRCRTYEEFGRAGRMGCYEKCILKKVRKANFSFPMFYGVDINFDKPIIDEKLIESQYGLPFAIKFRKLCLAACSQRQCKETRFEVSVDTIFSEVVHKYIRDTLNQSMEIHIFRPSIQPKIYQHFPQTSLANYFSLFGGALSLWFGLSIIHLYGLLKKFFITKMMHNYEPISSRSKRKNSDYMGKFQNKITSKKQFIQKNRLYPILTYKMAQRKF